MNITARNLLFFFICLSDSVLAQSNHSILLSEIDSLKETMNEQSPDSVKASILQTISANYLHINPDSSIYYGEKAIELFQKTNNVPEEIVTMGIIGECLTKQGNLPAALELSLDAINKAESLSVRKTGIGRSYDNMGEIYYYLGDYPKAIEHLRKLIPRGDVDLVGVAFGYLGIARVYEAMDNLDSAMLYLEKARKVFYELKNVRYTYQYEVYPGWYNLRAQIFLKQNKPELALADLTTSLEATINSEEVFHTSNTYIDISRYYRQLNQLDSSIYYAEMGITEANKISYINGIMDGSRILADIYESRDPEKAFQYYRLATETEKKLYGAGNIQLMREMIAQNEQKQQELALAETAFQNRLRLNALLGSIFTLVVIVVLLLRNNRNRKKAKDKIESAYKELKTTQQQLIQSEKMASLGELTAGIAHEIQNPLNFVNNFSDVNKELADELLEEVEKGNKQEAKAIIKDIRENEEKILHHGKRADGIVKGMLQHSRAGGGDKEPTDINALCDEYLRLSYHGLRAKDKSFNADFKTELEESIPKINVVPQDIGRVVLNLINNAFFAVSYKESVLSPPVRPAGPSKDGPGKEEQGKEFQSHASRPDDPVGRASASALDSGDYKPAVTVSTKLMSPSGGGKGEVQITIKDNGPGIPDSIKDKIFQPFFTTKATGEGTGLGLSLSYDIIKAHGGEIKVESEGNNGSEFKIFIPC